MQCRRVWPGKYEFEEDEMNQPEMAGAVSLAGQLRQKSTALAQRTPFDLVADTARAGELDNDQIFRLLGTEAQRLTNTHPRWVICSANKLTMIRPMRCCACSQRQVFAYECGTFMQASRSGHLIFTLRASANYAHNLRIASLNLGAKGIESTWLQRSGAVFEDPALKRLFSGLVAETESYIRMGRTLY